MLHQKVAFHPRHKNRISRLPLQRVLPSFPFEPPTVRPPKRPATPSKEFIQPYKAMVSKKPGYKKIQRSTRASKSGVVDVTRRVQSERNNPNRDTASWHNEETRSTMIHAPEQRRVRHSIRGKLKPKRRGKN